MGSAHLADERAAGALPGLHNSTEPFPFPPPVHTRPSESSPVRPAPADADPAASCEGLVEADLAMLREGYESFCRTVSQELRSPLRVIEGYAELVLDEDDDRLGATHRRHLQTIREQSRRLSSMLERTLSLARLMSQPLRRSIVDLTEIAADAVDVVRAETHAHDVEVRIEPGLSSFADNALAGRLVAHLIDNAFRASRASLMPLVEFGSTFVDDIPAFFVRDNGVGFDSALARRLFQPFATLQAPAGAAVAGMGLAEAERIVARHGGQIWAESTPGRGATFYFTLPDDWLPTAA
jgi:signal transduction histidine kinase